MLDGLRGQVGRGGLGQDSARSRATVIAQSSSSARSVAVDHWCGAWSRWSIGVDVSTGKSSVSSDRHQRFADRVSQRIYQNADLPERGEDRVDSVPDLFRLRHIGDDGNHTATGRRRDLRRRTLDVFRRQGIERDVGPASASTWAIPFPTPRPAPVMKTILPATSNSTGIITCSPVSLPCSVQPIVDGMTVKGQARRLRWPESSAASRAAACLDRRAQARRPVPGPRLWW